VLIKIWIFQNGRSRTATLIVSIARHLSNGASPRVTFNRRRYETFSCARRAARAKGRAEFPSRRTRRDAQASSRGREWPSRYSVESATEFSRSADARCRVSLIVRCFLCSFSLFAELRTSTRDVPRNNTAQRVFPHVRVY